jgi:hypothetical protein
MLLIKVEACTHTLTSNDGLNILDSVFNECTAAVDGGGQYFSTGSLDNVVSGCSITKCSAGDDGMYRNVCMMYV